MKYLGLSLLSFFLIISVQSSAGEIKEQKLELIKELKVLFKNNQEMYPLEIKENKTSSILKLIENAYAASAYQCLYGGWPSTTIKVNGKTYCHDAKSSDFYRHSYACKKNEFTCPKVLFGQDTCVPYGSRKERLSVYNACEENEKAPSVTNDLVGEDHQLIVEYVKLANEICEAPDNKKNIVKVNCEKVLKKTKGYEEIIKKGKFARLENKIEKTDGRGISKVDDECEDCKAKLRGTLKNEEILKISEMSPKLIYETLKNKYRASKLCNPIYNYPKEMAQGIALSSLSKLSKACSTWGKTDQVLMQGCSQEVARVKEILKPDKETSEKWRRLQNQIYSSRDDMGMYRIMLSAKKMLLATDDTNVISKLAQDTFLENNVLIEEEGVITCPFPSFDAFDKAFKGYGKLKGKLGKEFLTIADYTMPSNQRRLFTFDMENLEPKLNTWVAHGSGNGPGPSAESDGSNPTFSNVSGSNLSSDGFIIARNAARGNMFGDNILLDGVDQNNSNLRKRAIVLHGDSKAGGAYKALSLNQDSFKEKMSLLKSIDPVSADDVSIRKASTAPGYFYPNIGASWGCLGVPDAEALNIETGKYESQLQTIRRELAGNTLIFSYSGKNMSSKYF